MRDDKVQVQMARASRLRSARKKHFKSMKAAANFHKWSVFTFVSHERGARAFKYERAVRYANAFGIDVDWLWNGPEAESQGLLGSMSSAAVDSQGLPGRGIDPTRRRNSKTSLQPQ